MRDNVSPEEKLLRLIRGQKKPAATVSASGSTAKVDKGQPTGFVPPFSLKKFPNVSGPKKLIPLALGASCIYLALSLIWPFFGLKRPLLPKITPKKITDEKISIKEEIRPFEYYLEVTGGRQLFTSPAQEAQAPIGQAAADLIKDISLVGIIAGDNPQAIIEDKKAQKTYYVTKGQSFGEFQVEDIKEGKIILNYRGTRFELYL
ncbi:MAG: hypothetical protein FJZ09_05140 [Candidatus Omnitrophica bacterium]|nr:hypothetical protein [Candidatus Omnitrophota bacterium]